MKTIIINENKDFCLVATNTGLVESKTNNNEVLSGSFVGGSAINATYAIEPSWQVFSDAGYPGSGYKLWSFAASTTTPLATYTTPIGDVTNSNPVVFNAAGRATVCLQKGTAYKLVLTDSQGVIDSDTGLPDIANVIWSKDNCNADIATGFGVVNTIADLKALVSSAYAMVTVLGYYSPNDGGGGTFYWSNSQSFFDDGMSVQPHSGAGGWVRLIGESSKINVLWYGCKGDNGTTNNVPFLTKADSYAQYASTSLYFPASFNGAIYSITTDPIIVSPCSFAPGAKLKWTTNINPVITPAIEDNLKQYFDCPVVYTPLFPSGVTVYPQWFGAVGNGSNDDTLSIQKAVQSLVNGGTLFFPEAQSYYKVSSYISLNSDIHIKGNGFGSEIKFSNSATGTSGIFNTTEVKANVIIEDLQFAGNSANNSNGIGIAAILSNSAIRNCKFVDFVQGGIQLGGASAVSDTVTIENNTFNGCGNNGISGTILILNGTNVNIENNSILDSNSLSAFGIGLYPVNSSSYISNIYITNNKLVGCYIIKAGTDTIYSDNLQIKNNNIDLGISRGCKTQPAIYIADALGINELSGNTIYPNDKSSAILIHCLAINTGFYNICNNSIYLKDVSTPSVNHSGITISNSATYKANLSGNTIIAKSATLIVGTYGIAETGSGTAGNVTYGVNDIQGFAMSILPYGSLTPVIKISDSVSIDIGTQTLNAPLINTTNTVRILTNADFGIGTGNIGVSLSGSGTPVISSINLSGIYRKILGNLIELRIYGIIYSSDINITTINLVFNDATILNPNFALCEHAAGYGFLNPSNPVTRTAIAAVFDIAGTQTIKIYSASPGTGYINDSLYPGMLIRACFQYYV